MSSEKYWTDEKIIDEIRRVMELVGIMDRLPTVAELQKHSTCYNAINKYGGLRHFSKIMDLPVAGDVLVYKKTCAACGTEFSSRYRSTQFCSQACRNKSYESDRSKPTGKVKRGDIRTMRDVRKSRAFEKELDARKAGLHYGDVQAADSIARYARVEVEQ